MTPETGPDARRSAAYAGTIEQDKELQAIFERTYGPCQAAGLSSAQGAPAARSVGDGAGEADHPGAVLRSGVTCWVDGYNIIFAWDELKDIAKENLDAARKQLCDILSNYRGFRKCRVIAVFDAYKVKGGQGSVEKYHGIHVVYTKEAETADAYIERATYEIGKHHRVRVATSDGPEQLIILGHGAPADLRQRLPAGGGGGGGARSLGSSPPTTARERRAMSAPPWSGPGRRPANRRRRTEHDRDSHRRGSGTVPVRLGPPGPGGGKGPCIPPGGPGPGAQGSTTGGPASAWCLWTPDRWRRCLWRRCGLCCGGAEGRLGTGLLLGGGLSNLYERVRRGRVLDYLRFPRAPGVLKKYTYNLADLSSSWGLCCCSCGDGRSDPLSREGPCRGPPAHPACYRFVVTGTAPAGYHNCIRRIHTVFTKSSHLKPLTNLTFVLLY